MPHKVPRGQSTRDQSATIEGVVRRVIRPLRRRAPDYVATADLAQEARIACWEALTAYDGRASLSTFLYGVGLRAGLRWIRTEAHLRGITETQYRTGGASPQEISLDALGKNVGRDGLAERAVSRAHVEGFLQSLPGDERTTCRQRLRGLTVRDMSRASGDCPTSAHNRLTRVRQKAKEWFEL